MTQGTNAGPFVTYMTYLFDFFSHTWISWSPLPKALARNDVHVHGFYWWLSGLSWFVLHFEPKCMSRTWTRDNGRAHEKVLSFNMQGPFFLLIERKNSLNINRNIPQPGIFHQGREGFKITIEKTTITRRKFGQGVCDRIQCART